MTAQFIALSISITEPVSEQGDRVIYYAFANPRYRAKYFIGSRDNIMAKDGSLRPSLINVIPGLKKRLN